MPRKANSGNQTLFTQGMAENYFSAIKIDLDQHTEKINEKLNAILTVVNQGEVERKEVRSTLWEHEHRLFKLERAA